MGILSFDLKLKRLLVYTIITSGHGASVAINVIGERNVDHDIFKLKNMKKCGDLPSPAFFKEIVLLITCM